MINITNLTKIYRSKKRSVCHALTQINLTLPDTGLVFVLGKSGSGKSTLLNLIGGLDSITDGQIVVDGNDLSTFRERDFCNYRNTHIGFVFQDYHLIDELTIYDNIMLSLDLRRVEDGDKVRAALEKVDLAGYEDRFPGELSGGERQRIAIARAIVKNPRIILADEPTGNLDTNTATAITELLRDLSKNCLILVVSHNLNDANKYADRVIELSHGHIVGDRTRNPEFLDEVSLQNGALIYPAGLALSEADVRLMNENKAAEILRKTDKYFPTPAQNKEGKRVAIENKSLTVGKSLRLSGRFLKRKVLAISLSAFMVAVIMIIMALAQTIINFDAGEVMSKELQKSRQTTLLMNKTVDGETASLLDEDYRVAISESEVQAFYDAGYDGMIYPVINVTFPITSYRNFAGYNSSVLRFDGMLNETFGTLVVDEDFLRARFGEVHYLAAAESFHPGGILITDYVADCILALRGDYRNMGYTDLLGEFLRTSMQNKMGYVNAVIETGYREKHEAVLDKIKEREYEDMSEMYEDPDFIAFFNDIYASLGYTFTCNPSFVEDYKASYGSNLLFSQKIMVNEALLLEKDRQNRLYFVRGRFAGETLVSSWMYPFCAPTVPEGAKYMRVAFGGSGTKYDPNVKPMYSLFHLEHASVTFSNGYTPLAEVLDFERGVWLGLDGETVESKNTNSQVSDYIEIPEGATVSTFSTYTNQSQAFCAFYDENKNLISTYHKNTKVDIPDGTFVMNYENYNQLFGTEYTVDTLDTFKPHPIKLTQYRFYDANLEHPIFDAEVMVTSLVNGACSTDASVGKAMADSHVYCNALYFDGAEGIGNVVEIADGMNYAYQSVAVEAIHTMTRAVEVFVPIFELVALFLCLGVVFILVNFATRMIKDKLHEIGILKAIGTHNTTIGVVFGLQVVLIAFLTCIMTTVGYYVFIGMANDVLIDSLAKLAPARVMLDLDFLTFKPSVALSNCLLVFLLSILSLAVPMIKIKRIKPVQIIKAKE